MSRYTETFKTHAFQASFNDCLKLVGELELGDLSQTTSVSEILRLKKVISYINELLLSLDPELVPLTIWDGFYQQSVACNREVANFNSNKNIGHIQNANTNADNLLNYVRPYMLLKGKAKSLTENLFAESKKQIESYLSSFQSNANQKLAEIESTLSESLEAKNKLNVIYNDIDKLNEKLFGEDKDQEGIAKKINDAYTKISKYDSEIETLHIRLLEDTTKQDSIQTQVLGAHALIDTEKAKVIKLIAEVDSEIKELKAFYTKVFGEKAVGEDLTGGLSKEIDDKLAVLSDLESKNKIRYDAIMTEIQSLLPGATSAGLASAYREMKQTYNRPILIFNTLFYFSIFLLAITSIFAIFDINYSKELGLSIQPKSLETWDLVAKSILNKLPLFGAFVWLAFFVSKRRSEAQRLQQEYAHKEALAKSYSSYKKQIEALDTADKQLQKVFIEKMVEAIAFNASQTLDGNHGDKHPLQSILEQFSDKIEGKVSITDLVKAFSEKKKD